MHKNKEVFMKNLLLSLLKATDLIGKCTKSFPESDEVNYELFIYFLISIIEMILIIWEKLYWC